jgi:murein DD-endopeptidase MepM/ murein hydrolase activator NlpD
MNRLTLILLACLLAACGTAAPTPSEQAQPSETPGVMVALSTPVPTANPISSPTATLPPTSTHTPTATYTLTPTPTLTLTATNTLPPSATFTPIFVPSITPTDRAENPLNTPRPTWTPPPPDPARQLSDHLHLARPIPEGGTNWVARNYPYGSIGGGGMQVHLGVDMQNPRGTPIVAAADGVVLYAGSDTATQFGPQTDYYGNVVVIRHDFTDATGQPVFSLYGHMQRVDIQTGQMVNQGETIGIVGDSGVALGPHLHFEVRVGDPNDWRSTRNPELWMLPYPGFGVLAGRVIDTDGAVLTNVVVDVVSGDFSREVYTYFDETVNPDTLFQENFALGDLPAGYYTVNVRDRGRLRFTTLLYIQPAQTTWVDIIVQ